MDNPRNPADGLSPRSQQGQTTAEPDRLGQEHYPQCHRSPRITSPGGIEIRTVRGIGYRIDQSHS